MRQGKEIDEEVDFILKVSKAIGMKMLITVPSFDVKDKSVSEIKEEAVERFDIPDKVGEDMKISWSSVVLQTALLISLEQHMMW